MAIPKRLRMGPAAYITTSGKPTGNGAAAAIIGWDMADVVADFSLSETGQHHLLFCELLRIVVERLRMAGVMVFGRPPSDRSPQPADAAERHRC